MILSCPSCSAQFNIDPNALGATGRAVRCGKCKHQWHASRPLITLPADDLAFPSHEKKVGISPSDSSSGLGIAQNSISGSTAIPPSPEKQTFIKTAFREEEWMASLPCAGRDVAQKAKRNALIAAVALAGVLSIPLFMMNHDFLSSLFSEHTTVKVEEKNLVKKNESLKKEDRDIVLEGIPVTLLKEDMGRTILSIEGALINKTTRTLPVPVLQAQALNARGKVVKEWIIPVVSRELDPGQRQPFSYSMPFSEQGVVDIAFHFL